MIYIVKFHNSKSLIRTLLLLSFFFFLGIININSQRKKTKSKENEPILTNYNGFFNFSYNEKLDKITLEVEKLNEEFLYVSALSTGIGSNDIGLDRGQLGGERVVKFIKAGNKLLLIQLNYDYRAISDNLDEQKAVEEAFAKSVLWGFVIEKEENGKYYVDATDFLIRDVHNVIGRLQNAAQGNYKLDKSRSAFFLPRTKNFPQNSEFEVILTFTGKPEGNFITSVVPSPDIITVQQHHSFVQLPDNKYAPRKFDPRAGFFGMSFMDYATSLNESIRKRYITRHRLEKKDPNAEISEAIEPIVYYLDRGVPEPIRSALMKGAGWWNQAFEAIGFKDAFRVEMLPEGVDPLDIRYNVIQWVHRSTRGWSYGMTVTDPRTGEILKGHVSLGSLRVRQDFLIAEGLLAPYIEGTEISKEVEEMALARIRQLAAHEVGHTLGLAHNYSASTENLASVMDYPHPNVEIIDGKISLSNAYDNKIGKWDKVSIAYGYTQFANEADERKSLNTIIQNSIDEDLSFLSDQDARPFGSAHPFAHLWDNGKKANEELERIMQIRELALSNFGDKNIRTGAPYATLEEVLVPVYFFHRYQIEATSKIIGGLNYRYALRGDNQMITCFIPPEDQLNALDALLKTIQPEALIIPENVLEKLAPRPLGYFRSNELINTRTGLTFDALGAAETLADMVFGLILNTQRTSRLVEYHARIREMPGLEIVLDKLIESTWKNKVNSSYKAEIQHTVNYILLKHIMSLAASNEASSQVKAITYLKLDELKEWIIQVLKKETQFEQKAHYRYAIEQINLFQKNPDNYKVEQFLNPPAGSPIGMGCFGY